MYVDGVTSLWYDHVCIILRTIHMRNITVRDTLIWGGPSTRRDETKSQYILALQGAEMKLSFSSIQSEAGLKLIYLYGLLYGVRPYKQRYTTFTSCFDVGWYHTTYEPHLSIIIIGLGTNEPLLYSNSRITTHGAIYHSSYKQLALLLLLLFTYGSRAAHVLDYSYSIQFVVCTVHMYPRVLITSSS